MHAKIILLSISFLYSWISYPSVKESIIGAIPMGFNNANKDENDNKINDKSKLFLLHFFWS